MNTRQKIISVCLAIVLILVSAVGIWADSSNMTHNLQTDDQEEQVTFSCDSGFYDKRIILKLEAREQGEILYTLDGSAPVRGNDHAMVYDARQGIALECLPQEQVYTVKAAVCNEENKSTEICTRTYVTGVNVQERYETPVLSISGDPSALFGETGLLTGENRFLRGREYEREVQVTLFDRQGAEAFSQNCGLRIYGSGSRDRNQPSFRLYARSEYDDDKSFRYYFFEDDYNTDHVRVSEYKRLILRNSGNDNGYAYLRNELANRLSGEAGFPDVQHSSPVCVYVNGEYFGVYWFVNNYDDWYFEEKYGKYSGEMVVLEGQTSGLYEQEDEDEATELVRREYNAFYGKASSMDLNVDENWDELNQVIDVENFLQYMALFNYFSTYDYMVNNFRVYRYYSPENKYQSGTVFDGRYRFLMFDLDQSLGFSPVEGRGGYGVDELRTVNCWTDKSEFTGLFRNILHRPEGRETYTSYYLSLANYYFAPEKSLDVMEKMHESHADELRYLYDETTLLEGNYNTPENVDYNHALNEVDIIANFLKTRPAYAVLDVALAFDLYQEYELFLSNENQANISVDYAVFHDTAYEGTYFGEFPVTVTASPKCGYQFDHWLVNGDIVDREQFVITSDMIKDGLVRAECVTSLDPKAGLRIVAIKSRGLDDYIVLENFGIQEVNLKNFILSDDAENNSSSSLPPMKLEPGESVTVYCKNYIHIDALGKPAVNFSLKAGETLRLYESNGELLQSVEVPQLSSGDGVYRMDIYSGEFYEEIPQT